MTDTTKSIEVNGNVLGVVNAHPDSNITQNIYNTINPSELITQIKKEDIEKSKQLTSKEKEELEKKFYFIDDSYKTIFNIVCNDLDIKNNGLLRKLYLTMSTISNSLYWLLGNGGEGKSTTLIRLAVENVLKNNSSFYIDFENPSLKDDTVNDMIKHIKNNTNNKAYIFIDNPDIKIDLLAIFYKQIIKNNFEFVIVLAERKNRYYALKNNKDNTLLPLDNFEPISIPSKIKQLVYEKFSKLLGEKNHKIEEIINRTINDKNLAYVNATYKILYELSKTDFIPYKFDWVEYYEIANQRFKSLKNSYKYIAFFYYFRIKVPFSLFERLYTGEEKDLKEFREYYLGINSDEKHKEPIVFDSVKLSPFESKYFMRAKHEIIAELFFDDISGFSNEKFTQIFIDIIKVFDEKDNYQIDCLLQLFGNKRVHLDYTREYKIDFSFIDYIINDEALKNKFKTNFNLFGSIFLTRFWTLLETDKKEATKFLEKAVKTIPENLHFKTELAKVYQTQKKYDEAEKVLREPLIRDYKSNCVNLKK